ncbi:AB hydrolase superfamily protein B1A11.02 [Trametes pubescens]|uniref:AB hydrolase superfamily protein B1A11.02 n=1 Tax=Trametes pubescens TaxID=154538 RepID=A0A1M2V4R8_TRAPU|nr:AB hydrolase superfamily protein B1A11.02 [Trametes pubescens]
MDPELAVAVAASPAPPPPEGTPTPEESRAWVDKALGQPFKAWQKTQLPDESTYTMTDRTVPVEGAEIPVRCVVPAVEDENVTFPILFHMHGGGFMFGDINLDDYYLRRLAVDLKISVVNVEYRLIPEHTFPTPLTDCLAALKWVVENTSDLKADLTKGFILIGDSAGGNLAAVLAHEACDDPFFSGRQPTGQFLREPWLAHPDSIPERLKPYYHSMEENTKHNIARAPTREGLDGLLFMYKAPLADPQFSPLLYPFQEGLPPAYFQVMGLDMLRDDGVVYEQELRAAGVKTKLDLYPGVFHGFHTQFPTISIATKLWDDARKGIEWLLRGGE